MPVGRVVRIPFCRIPSHLLLVWRAVVRLTACLCASGLVKSLPMLRQMRAMRRPLRRLRLLVLVLIRSDKLRRRLLRPRRQPIQPMQVVVVPRRWRPALLLVLLLRLVPAVVSYPMGYPIPVPLRVLRRRLLTLLARL